MKEGLVLPSALVTCILRMARCDGKSESKNFASILSEALEPCMESFFFFDVEKLPQNAQCVVHSRVQSNAIGLEPVSE